jgi:hypothetical protein
MINMARTEYWVSNEQQILNPGERPFRSLDKAKEFAAKEAEKCSWEFCQTPPGADNDRGNGNFRCGVLSPHGIHIREAANGLNGEEYDVPEEDFRKVRDPKRADWILIYVIDRGTGYAADGEDHRLYAGPDQTTDSWDALLADIAGGDEILEAQVTATLHGRYHHLREESEYANGAYMEWSKRQGGFIE